MNRQKWAKTTAIITLIYGLFLLIQAMWPGWAMVQAGEGLNIAKIIGGLLLICWGIVFLRLKR
ncbi:hypothetical protein ES703_71063 [subsurface metagenome]